MRWEVDANRCPCCTTRPWQIFWAVFALFCVVTVVIVVPLALVARGPTVTYVSAEIECPTGTVTTQDCVIQATNQAGSKGLLCQAYIQIKSRSYSAGKAKMRLDFYPAGGAVALTTANQGQRAYTNVGKYGKVVLSFVEAADQLVTDDDRPRILQPTGTPMDPADERNNFVSVRVIGNNGTLGDYPMDIRGHVSSRFGPFSHTTPFAFKTILTGNSNLMIPLRTTP